MRFLSKKYVWIFLIIASSTIIFLHYNKFQSIKNIQNVNLVVDSMYSIDNTIFNLHYHNKTWVFKANEFKLDSNIFSIDARINNLERNGTKEGKMKLINKLIDINIDPEIAFNYIYFGFNNKLNKIQKNIEKLPQNAEISIKDNKINIKKEIIGVKLDKYLFYNNLIKLYKNDIVHIEIPVIKTSPNVTSDMLKKHTHKRSEFSTSIATSSSGRKYNIRKALNIINGTKIAQREKFSFNNCVGRRTIETGYKNAKIILDGEFVEGVGGGVCQVSSTLYNSVLLAGLNVITSQKHSQRVGYVKAGFDAMVNYGTSDLVFENNTEGDIYILCKYSDNKITISVYGSSLGNISYKLENEIINPIKAGKTQTLYDVDGKYMDKVMYNDECFELKKPRDGYTVKSYVIKYVNGENVDRRLLRTDKYAPQHGVIVYGNKQRELNLEINDLIEQQIS